MFTFPLSCSTLYQFVFATDFTWVSSGGIDTNWFRSTSSTTSSVTFGDAQRRRIIILCEQQWGVAGIKTNTKTAVTFPISNLNVTFGAIAIYTHGNWVNGGSIHLSEMPTLFSATFNISTLANQTFNSTVYFLIIGI